MAKGYVYILTNEAMPGIVKIGKSRRGAPARAAELYKTITGVPTPFDVYFEILCEEPDDVEAAIHDRLSENRVNQFREFFRIDTYEAKEQLIDTVCEHELCSAVCSYDFHVGAPELYAIKCKIDAVTGEDILVHEVPGILQELTGPDLLGAKKRYEEKIARNRERIREQKNAYQPNSDGVH